MTPSQHQEMKRAPSTGGLASQIIIEGLLQQKIEDLSVEISALMSKADTKLDPEKTYIPPRTTLIQLLATGDKVDEAILKLSKMESDDSVSMSEEELAETLNKLNRFMREIDSEETPRILVDPQEGSKEKKHGSVVAQVQEMNEKYTDFLSTLREYNVFKGYLRALFTPGNQIRNRMTARNCLPAGPVLFYVSEVRMRVAETPRNESQTAWIACAFMPAGTTQYILHWDEDKKEVISQRTTNIGLSAAELLEIPTSVRMNYSPQERLFFFSDTDLPLHPFFFEKPVPSEGAFEWAKDIQNNPENWLHLVQNIVPTLPKLFESMEKAFGQEKDKSSPAGQIYPALKKHRANLENPEFFLEFVLNLSALPRSEGVGMLDGMGGIVSGLMRTIFER